MDWLRSRGGNLQESFLLRFLNTFALPLIAFIIVVITTILVAIILLTYQPKKKLPLPENDRIECPGFEDGTSCRKVGCFWQQVSKGPSCFMKKDSFGYKVEVLTETESETVAKLTSLTPTTPYGESIKSITFKATYIGLNIVRETKENSKTLQPMVANCCEHVCDKTFIDETNKRYEVPVQEHFPLLKNLPPATKANNIYEVIVTRQDVFHFNVKRKNGPTLWDTSIGGLLLSNQYLQIASYLPSSYVYGLGEHVHDTLRHNMDFVSWPMFARDAAPNSSADQHNLYGVHPFYTCLETDGKSHGVLFLNSNAMEATFMPAPAISFRTIGGILDFFIFVGDSPKQVIQLYTSLIGRPMIPPYWSLGFQLSRYGYDKISALQEAINRTANAKIPQAVQFLDIDHMHRYMDFTYDNETFPDLPQFMLDMKTQNRLKWIIILDPAIAVDNSYTTWTGGLQQQVFIKRAAHWQESMFPPSVEDHDIIFGKVWPNAYAAFPDFFQNNTKKWWKDNILLHRNVNYITFDGLWIDMNEPANFETNEINPTYCKEKGFTPLDCKGLVCPATPYEDPPYNPVFKITSDRLSEKTLCMESRHLINNVDNMHYDVHSLYGWSQSQPTLEAAQEATGTRSLVISRSTYPSSGQYAGHWLGDNTSDFPSMKKSIIGMLEFNMFGIPYVGADVCGFFRKADAHLCKRWMQLGAFYPFYRNHNARGEPPQDPAYFGSEVAEASRKAVERRITLNPYLYTLFYLAHIDGSTVVRPLFHEFPHDRVTWDIDQQFMWGPSLMISPILEENRMSVNTYIPEGEWWYFHYQETTMMKISKTYIITTNADEYTPVFVRGGAILPIAVYDWNTYPEGDNVTTRIMDLYVFPEKGVAQGTLFMDDGISKDTVANEAYGLYTFTFQSTCLLTIQSNERPNFKGTKPFLRQIFIFKVKAAHSNSGNFTFTLDNERNINVEYWFYLFHHIRSKIDQNADLNLSSGKDRIMILALTINLEMNQLPQVSWADQSGQCSMLG